MNTLSKRLSSIVILSFFVLSAFANTGNNPGDKNKITESSKVEYGIYPIINTNKIRVSYKKSGNEKLTVSIYDAKKNLLFSDVQKNATSLKCNYNLDRIGKGTYYVKLTSGDFEANQKVVIGSDAVSKFSAYLSPNLEGNKVRIAYQHAESPVFISVLNSDGKKLFSKEVTDVQNFSSLFNLSSLDKGDYTIRVTSNNKSTAKTYTIK